MEDINFFNIKKVKEHKPFQNCFYILIITISINLIIYIYFSYKIQIADSYKKELNSNFSNIENRSDLDQKLKISEGFIYLENQNEKLNSEILGLLLLLHV